MTCSSAHSHIATSRVSLPEGGSESAALGAGLAPSLAATIAFACGLVASGRLAWLPEQALRIVAAWLAGDVFFGYALTHWVSLKRSDRAGQATGREAMVVPYAEPGSPGAILGAWLSRPFVRWRAAEHQIRRSASNAAALITGFGAALVLAAYAGPLPLASLACAGMLLALMAVASPRQAAPLARWGLALQLALALNMGHVVLGGWGLATLGLSAFLGIGVMLTAAQTQPPSRAAQLLTRAIWLILSAAILAARQPVLGGAIVICGLASDLASFSTLSTPVAGSPLALRRIAWLGGAMISAIALSYWS